MSDERILLAMQEDALHKLLSEAALEEVNIVLFRKLLVSSQVEVSLVYLEARNDKSGTGIVVGMPYLDDENAQTGISDATLCLPIYCLEKPDIAQSEEGGSLLSAEQIALTVRRLLRGFIIDGKVTLFTEGRGIRSFDAPPSAKGAVCYEVLLKGRLRQSVDTRCALPTISEAALTVTLANVTSGATIYYTTDGSFPGPGNAAAEEYSAPFAVASGTVVRWAAYKDGLSGSHAGQATIS
jgi:hypothetical protein